MANKLSFSKISSYSICGERYRLGYVEGYREKWSRASLLFGSAIDDALNSLLVNRDLTLAKQVFDKKWSFQWINGKLSAVRDHEDVVYAKADFDKDFVTLTPEDEIRFNSIVEAKEKLKWEEVELEDRKFYNIQNWESLRAKGMIILESYYHKVLPQFISVTAVQHKAEMINAAGDSIVQYLDFIATLQDGSVVLMDNKTTSKMDYYDDDSPATSPQLISYYFNNREEFGINAVGFVVMLKQIIKNKVKTCTLCNTVAEEGARHKTCAVETTPGVKKSRCNGEFIVTMNPEAAIKIFVSPVSEAAENLVLTAFDEANNGIENKQWYRNLTVCKNIYGSPCEFFNICWKGDYSGVIKKEQR